MCTDRLSLVVALCVVACAVASASGAGAQGEDETDLTAALRSLPSFDADGRFPWRSVSHGAARAHDRLPPHHGRAHLALDVDGDGRDETISARSTGVQCRAGDDTVGEVAWEFSLPGRYFRDGSETAASVAGGVDHTGDGAADLVVMASTRDLQVWSLWILDAATGAEHTRFDLEVGNDSNGSGSWDGSYTYLTSFDPDGDGTHDRIVLVRSVGWDASGRGVVSLDAVSGDVVWEWVTGAAVRLSGTDVEDLDGDGFDELVFATSAVANLEGRTIGGLSDDRAHVVVLDADGRIRWQRSFGGITTVLDAAVVTDASTGAPYVVAAIRNVPVDRNRVVVLDPTTGATVSSTPMDQRLVRIMPAESGCLVYGRTRLVARLEVHDGRPAVDAGLRADQNLVPWIEESDVFADHEGSELFLLTAHGDLIVTDADFEPLAFHESGTGRAESPADFLVLRREAAPPQVRIFGYARGIVGFEPAATPVLPWSAGAGVAALGAIGATTWALRRRARRRAISPHEARRHLLDALELSSHGAIAGLRSLRRLNWHLQALARGIGQGEVARGEARSLLDDVRENALPLLESHVPWIEWAELDADTGARVRSSLQTLDRRLDALATAGFDEDALAPVLNGVLDAGEALERDLQELRTTLESLFRAELDAMLDRVFEACGDTLREADVSVSREGPTDVVVRMDADELAFVLENLVSNAVRAMRGARRRELRMTWSVDHGLLVLDTTDTGCGIAQDDWERVLDSRYSSRDGGGAGLFRSRHLLRRHGGRIWVASSAPAAGTCMRMELPLARPEDSV